MRVSFLLLHLHTTCFTVTVLLGSRASSAPWRKLTIFRGLPTTCYVRSSQNCSILFKEEQQDAIDELQEHASVEQKSNTRLTWSSYNPILINTISLSLTVTTHRLGLHRIIYGRFITTNVIQVTVLKIIRLYVAAVCNTYKYVRSIDVHTVQLHHMPYVHNAHKKLHPTITKSHLNHTVRFSSYTEAF